MNWSRLTLVCLAVYFLGYLFENAPGAYWFLCKSTLSAIIVLSALCLPCKPSTPIAILETAFIGITLLAGGEYLLKYPGWAYNQYEQILAITAIMEALLLIWGAPRHELRRIYQSLGASVVNRLSSGCMRVGSADKGKKA